MTERTTDREALADEAQADAVEAQREATAGHWLSDPYVEGELDRAVILAEKDQAKPMGHRDTGWSYDFLRLAAKNEGLRADVTRLEGERDALRTAVGEETATLIAEINSVTGITDAKQIGMRSAVARLREAALTPKEPSGWQANSHGLPGHQCGDDCATNPNAETVEL